MTGSLVLWAEPGTSGTRVEVRTRSGTCFVETAGDLGSTPAASGGALQIESVVELGAVGSVIDRGCDIDVAIEMLTALFPCVEPGGSYRIEVGVDRSALRTAPIIRALVDAVANRWVDGAAATSQDPFVAYCLRNLASLSVGTDALTLDKVDRPFVVLPARPLSALEGIDSRVGVVPRSYRRAVADFYGPGARGDVLRARTSNLADVEAPGGLVAVLSDATVLGFGPVVVDGNLIDESLINTRSMRQRGLLYQVAETDTFLLERPLTPPHPPLPGVTSVVMKQTWDVNYGHWIVDTFPRVEAVVSAHGTEGMSFILNVPPSEQMRQVFVDSMSLVGVREEQLVFTGSHPYAMERAIYPAPVTVPPLVKNPRSVEFLRELALDLDDSADRRPRRLYVTRNGSGRRRLLNEDAVIDVLRPLGYEVVAPETLALREQMAVFRDATHVVGNMGAALSNLAFSGDGVRVLCLATEAMNHDYFYDIVSVKGGIYIGLQGLAAEQPATIASDFTIDIPLLEDVLSKHAFDRP